MNPNFSNINKSTQNDEKVKYLLLELNNFVEQFRKKFNTDEIDGTIEKIKTKIGSEFFKNNNTNTSNTCNTCNTCNNKNTFNNNNERIDSFLSNYITERPLPDADRNFISFGKWNDVIREVVRGVNHSYESILNKREIPINVTLPTMRGDQKTLREELQNCIVDGKRTTDNR